MALGEFDIIREFFARQRVNTDLIPVGVGDDAAVINTRPDEQLLISIDTLNLGVHFPQQTSAYDIGYKALAVNLSDIAAMGGEPKWFTLALSLPQVDQDWLSEFTRGLASLANQYQLSLVGGDTTKGPLSITIQIAGTVPQGKSLTRSGAQVGDDIYVTGTLGDAAGALRLYDTLPALQKTGQHLLLRLNQPVPRIEIGMGLRELATACIDVSDGLAADLGHILEASGTGADLDFKQLPVSEALAHAGLSDEQLHDCVLYGGDDYELCFTAAPQQRAVIAALSQRTACPITRIGKIIAESGLFLQDDAGHTPAVMKGYDHFAAS
jgi:thiamine-monophosphate kinase